MANNRDASSPFPWPPVIFGSAALLAGVTSWFVGWPFVVSVGLQNTALILGCVLIALGVVALVAASNRFTAAGTAIPPNKPTTSIVTTGIYGFTRNPMYLGMSLFLAGLGLALNQLWFLLALPFAIFAVTKLAIEREESYLAAKFGAEYLSYKTQVRRWF